MKVNMWWVLAGVLLLCPATSQADEMFDAREHLDKMKMELDLTSEQTKEVKEILEDYEDQLDQASADKKDKLEDVLNEEQIDKLDDMHQSWLDKMKAKFDGKESDAEKAADIESDREGAYQK